MKKYMHVFEQVKIARYLAYWTMLVIPLAVTTGSLVALFLWLLDLVTAARWQHLWLVCLLPFAGVLITFLYSRFGRNSDAGNNLIMEEIHEPGGGIPVTMTPLVLFSTVLTHLCGGSAGREGTAVQMGGSMAALFARWYRLKYREKRMLLMCGMAAGFGAVFGTPVAGTIFAMEVLAIGRIKYDALIPCFIAAVIADLTCTAYGIHHTRYAVAAVIGHTPSLPFNLPNLWLLARVIAAGAAFGLAGYLFTQISHVMKAAVSGFIHTRRLIPVTGGMIVILASLALQTPDYLGLGVSNPTGGVSIVSAFHENGAHPFSWLWKLLLTAVTLSTGFKGGEVTPLFFIGATLGNTLAALSGSPTDLFAALGFIAIFAGATNTPIACTLMGVELFGADYILYYAVACFTAYYFSGHSGIYGAQRIAVSKFHLPQQEEPTGKTHKENNRQDDNAF